MQNEKSYKNINYILNKSSYNCPWLVVVFSGFNNPKFNEQHPYHYMKVMQEFDVNVLFIQDTCGPRGCYYLCEHMDFEIENTVVTLIKNIAEMLFVDNSHIITLGSSKGGTAALYFGLKYSYGHIIAGVPQTKIASYLLEVGYYGKPVLDFMLRRDKYQKDFDIIDNILIKQVKDNLKTKINLLISYKDHLYNKHFIPLIDAFNLHNIKYKLTNDLSINNHNDISYVFPEYIKKNLLEIFVKHPVLLPAVIESENSLLKIYSQTGWRCSINKEAMKFCINKSENIYDFSRLHNEILEVKIISEFFINNVKIYSTILYENIFPKSAINFKGCSYKIENNILHFEIIIESKIKILYAFYIYENGQRNKVVWYSENNKITIPIKNNHLYSVQYFIKTPQGRIISDKKEIK